MTQLQAVNISAVIAPVILGPYFSGFVYSVLPHCVCLVSSHLCCISIEWLDLGKSANGVMVNRPEANSNFQEYGIAKGTECRRVGNILTFVGSDCSILMERIEPWNPKLLKATLPDRLSNYVANVDFMLSCLSLKLTNEFVDTVGLAPLVLLANGNEAYLEKAIQQEWRLKLLVLLHDVLFYSRSNDPSLVAKLLVNIFELGEVMFPFLIGFCAALWACGHNIVSCFQNGIKGIVYKTRKQVFVMEVDVILALQGNFSDNLHQLVGMILDGNVQQILQSLDKYSMDCILGICVGVKLSCCENDNWLTGIAKYKLQDSGTSMAGGNDVRSNLPWIFKQNSWRKLLNL